MNSLAVGFIVYLMSILIVGFVTARLAKTLPDFLLAGRKLGPWIVAFSERASAESGWMILGLTGLTYAYGLGDPSGTKHEPAIWTAVGGVCGVALSWFLVAKKLRKMSEEYGALTLPRFFELKFGGKDPIIRFVSSGIITFCFAFYVAAQFDAIGKSLEQTFHWSHISGVLTGATIIVIYTLMGGFFAVAWTDFVQGLIMLVSLVVLPFVTLIHIGGFSGLIEKVTAIDPQFLSLTAGRTGWTLFSGILGGFGVGLGYVGQPHLLARYMSIRSVDEIKTARSIAIGYSILTYGGAILMGLVALGFFGEGHFSDPEKMMPGLAISIFPAWFAGILISGALAAMMSTADSQLLVTTSAITEDIYHQSINPKASQEQLVLLSRIVTLILGVIAVILAQLPRSIFDKVLFAWGGLGAAFGPSLILSLWWSGTTRNGVMAGMVIGFITVVIWDNFVTAVGLYSFVPGFILAFLAIWIVSLLERRRDAAKRV